MAGIHHYCSYFDHRYLPRGLAMIRSLRQFDPDAVFWVFCLSQECEEALTRLQEPNVRTISMEAFLEGDFELQAARKNRSTVEFYFTCTPSIIRYVLDRAGPEDIVTYVDGDLYFFSTPAPLFTPLANASVTIIPHRFPEERRELERFGIYNVGWLSFRNDARGRAVAQWWRERCNEWCYDQLEDDRYADQKYLDRFTDFEGVAVIDHPGANVAPWNVERHRLEMAGNQILSDGEPLIFFHYQGLRELGRWIYFAAHHQYKARLTPLVRQQIYRPYLKLLSTLRTEVAGVIGTTAAPLMRGLASGSALSRLRARLQPYKRYLLLTLRGQAFIIPPK